MLIDKINLGRFKETFVREELIYLLDMILSVGASMIVFFGVELVLPDLFKYSHLFLVYLITSVVSSLILFWIFKTYKIIIRHLGPRDIIPFAFVSMLKGLILLLVFIIASGYHNWLFFVAVLDFLFTFFLLLGVRILMIIVYTALYQRQLKKVHQQRVLVYGTTNKSVATIKRLQTSPHYHIAGFLDRSDRKAKMLLDQLPVFNFDSDSALSRIISKNEIDSILFSRDTDAQHESNGLIEYCIKHKIKTLIVPDVDEVSEGQSLFRPRPVKVEDLLGRKEIVISLDNIKAYFDGKIVMVTGAAGSIGSELVRQLAGFGVKRLILFDNGETPMHNLRLELGDKYPDLDFVPVIGDVRQIQRLDFAFRKYQPQIVFHAAAYKHVPLMEENPCEAVLVNVYGTKNVADKCIEYGVEKMVMISTDKAVNPTNIMGCTKRLAEIYVQSLGLAIENGTFQAKNPDLKPSTKFVTTRFGNVLGSNGSVIPRFRQQIANGGPVTVTHKYITRFFMTIPEACRLVMEAATMSEGNQIFVFDMGEPVKIDQLARRMISLAGFTPDKDIKIKYTGLRPGEKLYEEVLANDENTLPSFHERIRIAKVRDYDYSYAQDFTIKLEDLARKVDIPPMVNLMKEIVPEYHSETNN
ncbi:MAG: polysaccharide biosynthesis protein [Bacteroidales bacterium]|nr:polysaccharide biosynthesis protein [Bacteroidales bacterium]